MFTMSMQLVPSFLAAATLCLREELGSVRLQVYVS